MLVTIITAREALSKVHEPYLMSQGVTACVMRDLRVTAGGCNGSIRIRTAQEKQYL